jgi:sulfonate transport system substrate-binding protein
MMIRSARKETLDPMAVSISHRSRIVGLAGLTAILSLGLGVGASDAASSTGNSHIPAGTVLNLGDQQQYLETALEASGALVGAPYAVNYIQFASGPLVDAGFAAHQLDLGFMGDLPASLAVQSGLPVKAIAVDLPIGASEYLVAKPGITSIAQLRGKTVAYTTGTAEQAFALRALATAGLTQKDVTQVNVSLQELGTVLESGAADASVVSVEQKVDYQETTPNAKVLATIDTVKPSSYTYVLATTAALDNPGKLAAIDDFTKRLIKAGNWVRTHESQYITDYYVDVEHQTPAVAKQILAAGGTNRYVPLNATVQAALQNVVKLLAGADALPKSYSVAPLFSKTESARYNTILQEVPQNG